MKLKTREELDPRYQWDFSDIYKTDADWEAVMADCETRIAKLGALAEGVTASPAALKKALDYIFETAEHVERAYIYASLHKEADNGNPAYQEMEARAVTLFVAFDTAIAFLRPALLSADADMIEKFRTDESLAVYRFMIEDTLRSKPHILDESRESLLSRLADAAGTPRNAYGMLESVDISFPAMKDENGNEIEITHALFGVMRESRDRRVREESFTKYFGEFKKYINTFAAMYAGSVKFDCFFAATRNYKSACEYFLDGGNVPVSVYDELVNAVRGGLPTMRRYLELRRRVLGLDELHMYDLYCPMIDNVDFSFTFEESRTIIKEALAPLGQRYAELLDEAYDNRWMDVYESKGKTTGAFSCGVYGCHPYVLLNYTNSLDDVYTVAHELGHAMHSYFSNEAQAYVNHDYRIMVAEVASTVNEVLLTRYLLKKETDPARRAYILNHFLEGFRTTIFRQTLFAEFERKAHEMYEAGAPLTAKSLSDVYRGLNETYYEGVTVDALQDIEWARIPHFYNAFYVYQYATGFSSAVTIADHICKTGDAERYLKFLTLGGSDSPLNELRVAGVDLTKPDAVANALRVFDETVTELEELLK